MAMYVFSTAGEAVGFVYESFIYDLEGMPLGRILGSRVHRLDGSYVGEWFHDMVVDKRSPARRAISPSHVPPRMDPPARGVRRRPVVENVRYEDAFAWLSDTPAMLAAE